MLRVAKSRDSRDLATSGPVIALTSFEASCPRALLGPHRLAWQFQSASPRAAVAAQEVAVVALFTFGGLAFAIAAAGGVLAARGAAAVAAVVDAVVARFAE